MTEHSFAVDQTVWARTGSAHEEPGTIVAIDDDEILVRLHVSAYKMVFGADDLRPIDDGTNKGDEEEDGTNQRRSSRRRLSPSSVSAEPTVTTTKKVARRSNSRSIVTPSPKTTSSITATSTSASDDEEEDVKKPPAKRKQSSPRADEMTNEAVQSAYFKRTKSTTALAEESSSISTSETTKKPASKKKKTAAKKPAAKKATATVATNKTKKSAAKKAAAPPVAAKKPKAPVILLKKNDDSTNEASGSGSESSDDDNDDDDDDKPFAVDYAPTGRATCRRCDESITKGSVRVSHVPLFRGKPGFRVYRHLHCALFSEEIETGKDVGGYRKLADEDKEALILRIEESKLEMELENEELNPDELTQVHFQGEMRKPAPGLAASLLPFQVEGISWMYHQERNLSSADGVPGVRGGVLADEMGMVRIRKL